MKDSKERYLLLLAGNIILWVFLVTTAAAVVYYVPGLWSTIVNRAGVLAYLKTCLPAIVAEFVLFWTGILLVYLTSRQLGIKLRVLGILFGLIPVAHLIMLLIILRVTGKECRTELSKLKQNKRRSKEQICKTKYPVLLVHGVFFRDFEHFNYWGRVPAQLEMNGATVYYGEHNSAASVDNSAVELEQRILQIVRDTGCEKLNVIAHSKGGLDMRTAIAKTSAAQYVATLTTVNTPHRGCEFADYLLEKIPESRQKAIAATYNAAAAKLGDVNPDFMAAVRDLTASACEKRNAEVQDDPGVYYQSVGSVLAHASGGRFPLNMTNLFVRFFDGKNDGLVGEGSFAWGADFRMLSAQGKRGISHGDVIDLNRENFDGFDVREFYVQLVAELKRKGY